MKRTIRVEWYEYDLTQPRCRKFFTEIGASLYVWYLKHFYNETARIL